MTSRCNFGGGAVGRGILKVTDLVWEILAIVYLLVQAEDLKTKS
jgi:hypothetical protein